MTKLLPFAGSGGGSKSKVKNDANTLSSSSAIQVVDLVSEGQIGGLVDGAKSVYFNDIPLQNQDGTYNYDGIEVIQALGTPYQDCIKGFEGVQIPVNVNQEIRHSFPAVQAITETNIDKVKMVVQVASLYESTDKGLKKTTLKFKFEISINDDGYKDQGVIEISGKSTSQFQRTYTYKLPQKDSKGKKASRWLVRMTKISGDASDSYVASLVWSMMYLISETKLNYPNSALIAVGATAENLNDLPTRSYLIDGILIQVPSNYNRETNEYEGVWNGTFKWETSGNPAWILYALLTNERWGLGNFIKPEQINKAKLYDIGRYCDEYVDNGFGGKEKRFEINTQITERSDAYELIQSITGVFRGMAYWALGLCDFTCDKPTDPVYLYNQTNVVNGEFTYMGASRNDRHTAILVTWNDPEQNYKQVVEYVEDNALIQKYGLREYEFTAFGCTSRGQANRVGRWIMYSEAFEAETVSFTVGHDSALVLPGDVIQIHDPYHAGKRNGGRLLSCDKKSAKLDMKCELDPATKPKISIRMPDGKFLERTLKVTQKGNFETVYWDEELPELPVEHSIWIVTQENLVPITARVVNVTQGEDKGTYSIECISHNPSKFDAIEKDLEIETPITSGINATTVGTPTNFGVAISTYLSVRKILTGKLDLSWTPGVNNATFFVEWRIEGENLDNEWRVIETKNPYAEIEEAENGLYHFKLYAQGILGNYSETVETYFDSEDLLPSPDDVQDFWIHKRTTYLELGWTPVDSAIGYELREGSSWDDSDLIVGNYAGTSFIHDQDNAGIYHYHIRAINSDGTYSKHVKTCELVLNAPICPEKFDVIKTVDRLELHWKSNPEPDVVYYEIREGISWTGSTLICQSKLNHTTIPIGTDTNRKFWLKAVASPGIYSDEATWFEIGIGTAPDKNIVVEKQEGLMGWQSHRVYLTEKNDDLVMEVGRQRCEYISTLTLGGKLTAHNTFSVGVTPVLDTESDQETWESLTDTFESVQGQRQWVLGSDRESLHTVKQIATSCGLMAEDYDAISLNGHLDSLSGKTPSVARLQNGYKPGRYANGMAMTRVSKAKWIALPVGAEFKFSMWLYFTDEDEDRNRCYESEIIRLEDSDNLNWMRIVHEPPFERISLKCSDGKTISVPVIIQKYDHVCVAVFQSATTRGLGIGVVGKKTKVNTISGAPMGALQVCNLNVA